MPGEISRSFEGPPDNSPYVPSHLYPKGPHACACGHHEGYHTVDDSGRQVPARSTVWMHRDAIQ